MARTWTAGLTLILLATSAASAAMLMQAPAGSRYVELRTDGETVLPNGRILTPVGRLDRVRPHPYGLTISRDGRWVVAVSSEGPQLSILDLADPASPAMSYIPDNVDEGPGVLDSAFMGAAIGPDNRTLYVAGAHDYAVLVFDLLTRERLARIDCAHTVDGASFEAGYVGDLELTSDGATLYLCDQSNFRVLVVDTNERRVVNSVSVGRYPFGIALSPDETRAWVANVGMFEYRWVTDADGGRALLPFPPFGVPSKEAEEGVVIDGKVVPGLGDMNDIRGMSVWAVDVSVRGAEHVVTKTKTGHLVGEPLEGVPAVGGSSPNSIVVTRDRVYVSNGSNDSITVIDTQSGERLEDIDLTLHERAVGLRGMIPFGLALSPALDTLYVCEAGVNAVSAIRLADHTVMGRIPTAWFPSKVAVAPDGRTLYVSCAKGLGSGPNAGPGHREGDPTSVGALMRGYVESIPIPSTQEEWDAYSARVVTNTVRFVAAESDGRAPDHPVPAAPGAWETPIKHVVYVTKENRTYDEVFGALPGGRGDAELCRLGRPIDVSNADGSKTVRDVVLMPNHVALARRFARSDNFYCDSDHSADGHRWLVGTYPNEFVEAKLTLGAKYELPGEPAFTGASGAIYPEDYNEAGSIWEHFDRNGVRFANFGLGFEIIPAIEEQEFTDTGIRLNMNIPMPKPLFDNTSRKFATYNTNIPDQFRMDMFEEEFKERWVSGAEPFPDIITIMLPNDHGADERPGDGYPFWGSYMSDNDLALGRLVELISHSPWWPETVVFVTEDDAQGYRDTVDAHRSVLMVISPYAKGDYVSHVHTSFGSILKSMFLIHGLPPLNHYDAFATDLADCFTTEPANAEPYRALPVNAEVFDPQRAFDPFDREFNWQAVDSGPALDDQRFLDTDRYGHSGTEGHAPRD